MSLPCSTVGNPPPRLSWIHRDSLVYSGEQFQVIECGFAGGDFCICSASHLENGIFQVLSDGTLLMKEVRENIEELTCQVKKWPKSLDSIGARFQKCLGPVKLLNDILGKPTYGWNFSRCIFSPNIVTFFATLTAVFEHFLHWFDCFNYFYGSITCATVGKTKFLTRHLR